VDVKFRDQAPVTLKNWQIGRPSRKLADLWSGPYEIIEQVRHAYRLNLPENLKVHPVFNSSKLRLASKTAPLNGQIEDPPSAEVIQDSQEWKVKEILASRLHYRKLQYRVNWIGHDGYLVWYPASNFRNAPQKPIEFHDIYTGRLGPPMRV
jgi:hypothetical protein